MKTTATSYEISQMGYLTAIFRIPRKVRSHVFDGLGPVVLCFRGSRSTTNAWRPFLLSRLLQTYVTLGKESLELAGESSFLSSSEGLLDPFLATKQRFVGFRDWNGPVLCSA